MLYNAGVISQVWIMTEQENEKIIKLDPVKKEVFDKVQKAHHLLLEVYATNIDGDVLYDASKMVANIVASPASPEYNALCNDLLERSEKLMQYILDKGIS